MLSGHMILALQYSEPLSASIESASIESASIESASIESASIESASIDGAIHLALFMGLCVFRSP
jgi:hypothetical protein